MKPSETVIRMTEQLRTSGLSAAPRPTLEQLSRVNVLIEELEKLREDTPKPRFLMTTWCAIMKAKSKTILNKLIGEAVKNPCGTSACLAGKAGLIPKIRRMGFRWETLATGGYGQPASAGFRYKSYTEDHAVQGFFGEKCYWEVFMNMYGINTLLQGIDALKKFHKRESRA